MTSDDNNILEINVFPDDFGIRIVSDEENEPVSSGLIHCIITDQAGGKSLTSQLPPDVYVARLAPILAQKMQLPLDVRYGIQHKETGRQLRPSDTLSLVKVENGNTIRLLPSLITDTRPGMLFRQVQLVDALLTNRLSKVTKSLKGLFLYSDVDVATCTYIFNNLKSNYFYYDFLKRSFFVVEEPCPELKISRCVNLGNLYEMYAGMIGERLDFGGYTIADPQEIFKPIQHKSYHPLNQKKLFRVGDYFGIRPDQFPCVFLYEELTSTTGLVIEINKLIDLESSNIEGQFRDLFYELGTNLLLEEDWKSASPLDEIQKEMTKWALSRKLSPHAIQKNNMSTTIIEAIAATIDLLDQP